MAKAKAPKKETYYKIRNKKTGLYSSGGTYGHWSKKGKTWTAKQHLAAHLSQFININYGGATKKIENKVSEDWEIVEIEPVVKSTESALEYVKRTSPKFKEEREKEEKKRKKEEEEKRFEEEDRERKEAIDIKVV